MKILILTDDMPWGHRSIARAIVAYLKPEEKRNKWRVEYAEVKAEIGVGLDLYRFFYRFSPKLNRISYKLASGKKADRLIGLMVEDNLVKLKRLVNKVKPDLIISTYYFHSHSLAKWKSEDNLKFALWTVVADPWTVTDASYVSGADLHLVYDEMGVEQGLRLGISKEKILKTGWWVRGEMNQKVEKKERLRIRKNLGFVDDRPVIFVGGGSLGTNSLTKLLPVLLMVEKPMGVIVNTGTDKMSYRTVNNFMKIYARLKPVGRAVQIKNMGWIDNMAGVLSACDIVFGKAGPNFLFDSVAMGKPFVAITHIGGQEDGNIDLIREKGLGWVKEKKGEASRFLLDYLDRPKFYNKKFEKTIRDEGEENRKCREIIIEAVRKIS